MRTDRRFLCGLLMFAGLAGAVASPALSAHDLFAQNQGDGGFGPAILGASPALPGGTPAPRQSQNQNSSPTGQTNANAPQPAPGAGRGPGVQANRPLDPQVAQLRKFMDDLSMTEDQRDQVRAIMQSLPRQLASVRQDSSIALSDKQQKLKDVRQEASKQFVALLTPEQKQRLKQIRQQQAAANGTVLPNNDSDPAAGLVSGFDVPEPPANSKAPAANPARQPN